MATRIAHISDLHFPARDASQVTALAHSIATMAPDILLVTGDLTRSGRKEEFRQAKAFIDSVNVRAMVLPGNHDIPVPGIWARLHAPFKRFDASFPQASAGIETADLVLVGLNSAVGWQPGPDWSLGYVLPGRVDAAVAALAARGAQRLGIVACHHPLHPHAADPVRSRTFGGEAAFDQLAAAGMDVLLHGHLHRTDSRSFAAPEGHEVSEICANTALANRERGGPAGYNILDVEDRRWRLTVIGWSGSEYQVQETVSRQG